MRKFIYVFRADERDILLKLGYKLLKEDIPSHIYVFANSDDLSFANCGITYILSDILTF